MHHARDSGRDGRVEKRLGAADVGVDERRGGVHRSVDVRFRGEVNDCVDALESGVELVAVADVGVDESVLPGLGDRCEVGEIAGVGERVIDDDLRIGEVGDGALDRTTDERRPDDPGPAGDEHAHPPILPGPPP